MNDTIIHEALSAFDIARYVYIDYTNTYAPWSSQSESSITVVYYTDI